MVFFKRKKAAASVRAKKEEISLERVLTAEGWRRQQSVKQVRTAARKAKR